MIVIIKNLRQSFVFFVDISTTVFFLHIP